MLRKEDFSVPQTAQKLKYTVKYIFDLLYAGKLNGARKVGGRWRIPSASVEQWCKRKGNR